MNKKFFIIFLISFFLVSCSQKENLVATNLRIFSDAFAQGGLIPTQYTCDGENINPPLNINGVPLGTQSLVLIVEDPDAPTKTWLHWSVWNINPAIKVISEGSVPDGAIEGLTDFGVIGYGGPCPPSGTHRYFFKLYALDAKLNLPAGTKLVNLKKAIKNHIIAQTQLMGKYQRRH